MRLLWLLNGSLLFVYDGWNMLAELDAMNANAPVRSYVWGLDLSGSRQGAGGVGGLLFANVHQPAVSTYSLAYDGNGNVTLLVDQAAGAIAAEFEYGAFGELLKADGPAAHAIPFGFSTKYRHAMTGLVLYPYRPYSTDGGRWLSRDPMQEIGGVNLNAFVDNSPIGNFDAHGLLKFNFGIGLGGGGSVHLPATGSWGLGFSVFYSVYGAFAVDTSRTGDVVQCAICHSGSITVTGGVGAAINVGGGPVVTFGPSGDLNDLSGSSIQAGLGVGLPITPSVVGPSVEVTVDVDIK